MTNNLTLRALDIPSVHRFGIGFDSMFDDLMRTVDRQASASYPPYNIVKHDDNTFSIELAVAGFKEGDIEVGVENNQLSITGNKAGESVGEYVHRGISARSFARTFTLAEHVVVIGAAVENGILEVKLERQVPEEKKPRKVPITFAK